MQSPGQSRVKRGGTLGLFDSFGQRAESAKDLIEGNALVKRTSGLGLQPAPPPHYRVGAYSIHPSKYFHNKRVNGNSCLHTRLHKGTADADGVKMA